MAENLDLLGLKPLNEAVKIGTQEAVKLIDLILAPSAAELGFMLHDQMRHWRDSNFLRITSKSKKHLENKDLKTLGVHPRIVGEIVNKGTWANEDEIVNMWAGLLASSCSEGGYDDSNLIFTNILGQLTSIQVRILSYTCEEAPKYVSPTGLPFAEEFSVPIEKLFLVCGTRDIHRLDRELDHLRSLDLIGSHFGGGGLDLNHSYADVHPSGLGMHLYVRGQGFGGSPVEYWGLKPDTRPMEARRMQY